MMAEREAPVLMLLALHLRSMAPMLLFFWRLRSLERGLKQQAGVLRTHRWLSRRSLLVMAWWRDRASAEAWLAQPPAQNILQLAGENARVSLWVELYQLTSGAIYRGARGAPALEPGKTEQPPVEG